MLFFNICIANGAVEDAEILKDCLVEWDEIFEDDDPSLEVVVEELYGHLDSVDEPEELALSIAKALPDCKFSIDGCIDASECSGEYMDFLIEYKNKKLISKHSSWYVKLYADEYDDYGDFAESYRAKDGRARFSQEQFEAFKQGTYFILESGFGDCVEEIPLDIEHEIDLNCQNICPICGESLYQGVPVCEDNKGTQYHIWCAEDAGIEAEIV